MFNWITKVFYTGIKRWTYSKKNENLIKLPRKDDLDWIEENLFKSQNVEDFVDSSH